VNEAILQVSGYRPPDLVKRVYAEQAIATDGNLRFGNLDATFITTKPLVTNTILPQFARLGDRIVAYANHLEPGVYHLHYLVRSVAPETFIYPGAEVHLQYIPEEFGRTADFTLILEEHF
jgi:uncharacterized protein YfaS (alpha-2-macroglobulin family)